MAVIGDWKIWCWPCSTWFLHWCFVVLKRFKSFTWRTGAFLDYLHILLFSTKIKIWCDLRLFRSVEALPIYLVWEIIVVVVGSFLIRMFFFICIWFGVSCADIFCTCAYLQVATGLYELMDVFRIPEVLETEVKLSYRLKFWVDKIENIAAISCIVALNSCPKLSHVYKILLKHIVYFG